ncbi:primase alpha helix C-terminal domain-containing protein [Halobacillus salinarum]|uniref:Primase alpha helix C-terminal domain-containing protein n=1 Tax=Halobacillus salinarum TaxID=2932257 RepID=A0ABY4EKG1_9BACI|nr:primase alpha helix C-terminal domain-containing protein [Halobacillus salinarum]UOQ44578.1 primase alpha helix C-terminal domain-containing protein [Halobacillus salinarum]
MLIKSKCDKFQPKTKGEWKRIMIGVEKGRRNNTAASISGHLLRKNVATEVALELLKSWNKTNAHPPLTEKELVKIYNSIANKESIRRRGGGGI